METVNARFLIHIDAFYSLSYNRIKLELIESIQRFRIVEQRKRITLAISVYDETMHKGERYTQHELRVTRNKPLV